MDNAGKVALATLQLTAVVSSITSVAMASNTEAVQKPTQTEINQASLKAIAETWLQVPRICKAAAFNAQPLALPLEARSESVAAIYAQFAV